MFRSTKILELGSCAFRQPRAQHSHCRFIHGYKLSAKFWFEATELDQNHWVVDFGGLKGLKKLLETQFDHTTCIAADDPALPIFQSLVDADACDLRIMPNGTGIERIAEFCHMAADAYVDELTDGRCKCIKVEVFEHEKNSAIYEKVTSAQSGAEYMNAKADEISARVNDAPEEKEDNMTRPPFSKKKEKVDQVEESTKESKYSEPMPLSSNDTKIKNKWIRNYCK